MATSVVQYEPPLESSSKVFPHGRWAHWFIEGPISQRPSLLFVSLFWTPSVFASTLIEILYSLTIGFTICTAAFIYSPVIPPGWHNLFLEPTVAIASIMACRLFRELKLGLLAHGSTEGVFSTVVLTDVDSISQQQSGRAFEMYMYYHDGDMNTGDNGVQDTFILEENRI
jgi:hypothetical protein